MFPKTGIALCILFISIHCNIHLVSGLTIKNGDLILDLNLLSNGAELKLNQGLEEKLNILLGESFTLSQESGCTENDDHCILNATNNVNLEITTTDNGFVLKWSSNQISELKDCINFGEANWFGGSERHQQDWPIEKLSIENFAYVTSHLSNAAIAERYWLNSKGAYVYVDEKAPLFIDQNHDKENNLCLIANVNPPYSSKRQSISLEYTIVAKSDAREAHLDAVEKFLGKPSGYPNEWIIRNPIWTTWAKYKKDINDEVVVSFAQDIADHGFTGQIEIDDYWETCYGSLIFNEQSFANINSTVQTLKDLGFTVTLWTHPFINTDCQEAQEGLENDYFIKTYDGNMVTKWWNGEAYHVDFTKEEARNWYKNRLNLIRTKHGIDNFKFDAGETDYAPQISILNGDIDKAPNFLTTEYVKTCASMGDLLEVRSGWKTQSEPILVRMIDKDSKWGTDDNGLKSLITTLLQMNINGYNLILPDMIGGNGYNGAPNAELLARWTEVNTFMPAMQFSYLPWEITSDKFDGNEIIKKFVDLHQKYADNIIQVMKDTIETGHPVNPPIWWMDPTNPDALKCDDQFLLGEKILVAPIVEEGATKRDIVIPKGTWKDGNDDTEYEGPQIIKDYDTPIDVLPYFIKQ